MKIRAVVVIDPQGSFTQQLPTQDLANIEFHRVESVAEAKQLLCKQPCTVGLVVFDSPTGLTHEEVEPLVASSSMTEWIAVVAPQALESADFKAFVLSAFHDYHSLPLDLLRLLVTIGHAWGKARLRLSLNGSQNADSSRFGICGNSPLMQAFFKRLEKVINVELAVLIGGETGTGKELVAQAIHKHSPRSSGPFVVVNCGAIPANLIQSELFGHEKGAFTGAVQRKIGSIEAANGGDLFLDEIGDLPLSQQVNLLRVLQERSISRLGSTQVIPVDFRIIAATNVDLHEAVQAGRFREDLYYRLNVVHLCLPPLRHRDGDVRLLAEAIFRRYSTGNKNCRTTGFSTAALRAMNAYHWPGNVRELMNRVHRAVILSDNKLLSAADLGLEAYADEAQNATLIDARSSLDRTIVENSLRANANNVSRAARQLGVSRVTLYRMMSKHNIAAVH
ncbi:sigma 54-interacting transcriptional regulator [Propionivibrio sp.]|uniref:sigma-54 dependent transcriptional regulator n=1 Tax=Propionivibrio sp. TaxID=2212460 RepID=UPI003BF08604